MFFIARSFGMNTFMTCVLYCVVPGASIAGGLLNFDLAETYGPEDLVFAHEQIVITDCAFTDTPEGLWVLSARKGKVYRVAPGSSPLVFIDTDSLGVKGLRFDGMWGIEGTLFFGVTGKSPELLEFSTTTSESRHWPQTAGVYDLAIGKNYSVTVPVSANPEETDRILVFKPGFQASRGWGERCPPEFDFDEPILRLACLNKIDMGPQDAVYIASLNTGRCEKLTLDDNSSVSFREPDPGWTMPSLTGDRRLSTDTMVLDIAASPTGNEVFVLTSPKGIHGRHTLEVYRDESLVEELPLPGPFSSVVCGPGNRVALIKDQPPARIHVYKYEGSS